MSAKRGTFQAKAAAFALAVVVPLAILAAVRIAVFSAGEPCVDGFYHSAAADLGPSFFTRKTFPTMTMSTWEDCFYDKELGWHAILWLFQSAQKHILPSGWNQFTPPTLFFAASALAAFTLAAFRFGLKSPLALSALLVTVSPMFTGRLLMLRPHVLSIALVMVSLPLFARASGKRGLSLIFLLSFVYAWCYSNPHLILLPAAVFAALRLLRGDRAAALMPLAAAAGLVAGMTLHPQFPNTFVFWKIQCADVVINSLGGGWIAPSREMTPMKPGEIPVNAALLGIFLFNSLAAVFVWRKRGLAALSTETLALLALSVVSIAGLAFTVRPVEYACPFVVLSLGLLLRDAGPGGLPLAGGALSKYFRLELALIVAALAAANMWYLELIPKNKPFAEFKKWAAANMADGQRLANLAWSDFPQLFHAAPNLRYLGGLDPIFLYRRAPEKAVALDNFCRRGEMMTPAELRTLTGADLCFISHKHKILAGIMLKSGFAPLHASSDGWVFDLARGGPPPP